MTDQDRQQSVVNELVTQSGKVILMCDLVPVQFNSSRNLLVRSNCVPYVESILQHRYAPQDCCNLYMWFDLHSLDSPMKNELLLGWGDHCCHS